MSAEASGSSAPADSLQGFSFLVDDLPLFAAHCLKIKDKGGKLVPLIFNRSQLYLHERLEAQKARTGKVRAIICKGRQTSISTYVSARFYHKTAMTQGIQTFILT